MAESPSLEPLLVIDTQGANSYIGVLSDVLGRRVDLAFTFERARRLLRTEHYAAALFEPYVLYCGLTEDGMHDFVRTAKERNTPIILHSSLAEELCIELGLKRGIDYDAYTTLGRDPGILDRALANIGIAQKVQSP